MDGAWLGSACGQRVRVGRRWPSEPTALCAKMKPGNPFLPRLLGLLGRERGTPPPDPMKPPRCCRLGAVALVLLLLSELLPAFASPGVWVCPNGSACPWMNRPGAVAHTASCVRACCRCPGGSPSGLAFRSVPNCRFVSFVRRGQPISTAGKAPTVRECSSALPPHRLLADLLAFGSPPASFPPSVDSRLPRSFLRPSSPSRAPPIG